MAKTDGAVRGAQVGARSDDQTTNGAKKPRGPSRARYAAVCAVVLLALGVRLVHDHPVRSSSAPAALSDAQSRVKSNPDDLEALIALAQFQLKESRLDDAARSLNHAAEVAPKDPRPHGILALIAIQRGQSREAEKELEAATQCDPTDPEIWKTLGDLREKAKQPIPAAMAFKQAVELRPADSEAWRRLGILYRDAGWVVKGLEALQKAEAADPHDWAAQSAYADLALKLGRLPEAKEAIARALAAKPDDPGILQTAALVTLRTNPTPEGIAEADRQIEKAVTAGSDPFAYQVRGRVRLAEKRYDEAIADLKTALKKAPDLDNAYVYLSQAYSQSGRFDLARQASDEYSVRVEKRLKELDRQRREMQEQMGR